MKKLIFTLLIISAPTALSMDLYNFIISGPENRTITIGKYNYTLRTHILVSSRPLHEKCDTFSHVPIFYVENNSANGLPTFTQISIEDDRCYQALANKNWVYSPIYAIEEQTVSNNKKYSDTGVLIIGSCDKSIVEKLLAQEIDN